MSLDSYSVKEINDICKINASSYSKKDNWDFFNYLDTKNITKGEINEIKYLDPSIEKIPSRAKRKVNIDDIIISTVRPNQEHYGMIKYEIDNFLVSTGFTTLTVDKTKAVPQFIYYYITQNHITEALQTIAEQSTTSYPSIRPSDIGNIIINLPPLEIQNRISNILSNIENKIEINKRINKNLEEQIETIYNSFFVYFDGFQKEDLEECEIGVIPKDWKLMSLGEITTKINKKVGNEDYKVFSAVNTGNLILSEEYFDKQVYSKSIEKYIVVKQKEFAYNPARINIGSIGRNDFSYDGCVSPVYVAFKVEEGYENFMNMYIKSNRFNQWVVLLSSGSVRQTLNYNDFSLIKIAYPPKELVDKFNKIYNSFYDVINYNISVINNLERIRDILLPKLMSGEIDVSKINCDLKIIIRKVYIKSSKLFMEVLK